MNENDIDDVLESIYRTIISNIHKPLEKRSSWITDLVLDDTIITLKYSTLLLL